MELDRVQANFLICHLLTLGVIHLAAGFFLRKRDIIHSGFLIRKREIIHSQPPLIGSKLNKEAHVKHVKQCLVHRICFSVSFFQSSSFLVFFLHFYQQVFRVEDGTMRLFREESQSDCAGRNSNYRVSFLALPTPSYT